MPTEGAPWGLLSNKPCRFCPGGAAGGGPCSGREGRCSASCPGACTAARSRQVTSAPNRQLAPGPVAFLMASKVAPLAAPGREVGEQISPVSWQAPRRAHVLQRHRHATPDSEDSDKTLPVHPPCQRQSGHRSSVPLSPAGRQAGLLILPPRPTQFSLPLSLWDPAPHAGVSQRIHQHVLLITDATWTTVPPPCMRALRGWLGGGAGTGTSG